ncbi:MAG: hypothetical protein EA352_04765 [Gemmatimonadales bacterium]|nr:MAG: hypothetical protein EA352_04765 [Gemmatimonadales bacterium]
MRRVLPLLVLLALILLPAGCGDTDGPPRMGADVLATAGGLDFTVDEAAELIRDVPELPPQADVARALAEFWVDYTTLAFAMNNERGLDAVDLSGILRQQENQLLVSALRDQVIDEDFEVTDEEVAEYYEADRPGERVRARHILLLFPDGADEAQRDSVEALAEELRDRARAGEDFASLAETYSDDEGSAARGGDLSFFARGTMVPPFEEAAFALEPGDVSDIVESQFGLHVIRLEERDFPDLEDVREDVREQLRSARTLEAESEFIEELEARGNIQVEDDAVERMRAVAEEPAATLTRREEGRVLVSYTGGEVTVADFRDLVSLQGPQVAMQVVQAPEDGLVEFLRDLARSELLVLEAREAGLEADQAQLDAVRDEIHDQYRSIAEALGIDTLDRQDGESLEAAVSRTISELMGRIVRGESDVYPLDALAAPLRSTWRGAVSEEAPQRVAERVAEARGTTPLEEGESPTLDAELEPFPDLDPDG